MLTCLCLVCVLAAHKPQRCPSPSAEVLKVCRVELLELLEVVQGPEFGLSQPVAGVLRNLCQFRADQGLGGVLICFGPDTLHMQGETTLDNNALLMFCRQCCSNVNQLHVVIDCFRQHSVSDTWEKHHTESLEKQLRRPNSARDLCGQPKDGAFRL